MFQAGLSTRLRHAAKLVDPKMVSHRPVVTTDMVYEFHGRRFGNLFHKMLLTSGEGQVVLRTGTLAADYHHYKTIVKFLRDKGVGETGRVKELTMAMTRTTGPTVSDLVQDALRQAVAKHLADNQHLINK